MKVGNSFLSRRRLIGLNRTLAAKTAQRLSVRLTLVCVSTISVTHSCAGVALFARAAALIVQLNALRIFSQWFRYPSLIAVVGYDLLKALACAMC